MFEYIVHPFQSKGNHVNQVNQRKTTNQKIQCTEFFFRFWDDTFPHVRTYTEILNKWEDIRKVADSKQYRKLTVEKMRTNPAKLANLPPHVLQHIGYRFHDLVVNCEYGESDMLCNESNAVLFTDEEMLNCYTLKLIQGEISDSGPNDGLSLLLYIGKNDVAYSSGNLPKYAFLIYE